MSTRNVTFGLAGYATISVLAYFTLDSDMRWAVWVLMGGLALKTLVAAKQLRAQHAAKTTEGRSTDEVDSHEK